MGLDEAPTMLQLTLGSVISHGLKKIYSRSLTCELMSVGMAMKKRQGVGGRGASP